MPKAVQRDEAERNRAAFLNESEPFKLVPKITMNHHLDDTKKESLFVKVYDMLPEGGIFVNYDQFCADTPMMNDWLNIYWERQLYSRGLTERDIEFKCIYSYQKFSVILAVK